MLWLVAVSPAAQAATDKEALKCGLALFRIVAKGEVLTGRTVITLCKHPEDLSSAVEKFAATMNKAIMRFNARFSAANCDPDAPSGAPLPLPLYDPATLSTYFATLFPTKYCNNVDDP